MIEEGKGTVRDRGRRRDCQRSRKTKGLSEIGRQRDGKRSEGEAIVGKQKVKERSTTGLVFYGAGSVGDGLKCWELK